MPSNFVFDDLNVPDGKSNVRALTGLASKAVTAEEWNLVMGYLEDIRSAIVSGDYSALRDYAAAVSEAGTARLRYSSGVIQASIDGGAWRGIVPPANHYTNEGIGILTSNTAEENSDAWDAWIATIPVGSAVLLSWGPGTFYLERTAEKRREIQIEGTGGLNQDATYLRWNSGNMCGFWVRGSDTGDGSGAGSVLRNLRISSGGLQAYTDGRTATTDGTDVVFLSGNSGQLSIGRWVIINSVTAYITEVIDSQHIRLSEDIPAGSGLAIAFAPFYGVYYNARIKTENVQVDGNFTTGVYGYGNVASGTDASSSIHIGSTVIQCTKGFDTGGPDGNNVTFMGCNTSANTTWGFDDFSFLGNNYVGCHAENNGDAYRTSASTAESAYTGCYAEAGQEIDIAGQCYWLGGTVGDGVNAFVGAGPAFTGGFAVGNAIKNIFYNAALSSGYVSWGGDRSNNGQFGRIKSPQGDGGESWFDGWNQNSGLFTYTLGHRAWGSVNSGAAQYTTGAFSRNPIGGPSSKVSYPCSQFSNTWYWNYYRQCPIDAQRAGRTIAQEVQSQLGHGYPIQIGDTFVEMRPAAGQYAGWKCTGAGTSGTYSDGRTITGNGTNVGVLSGANTQLEVGQYVTIGAVATYITAINGLNVTVNNNLANSAGLAVSFTAPTYATMGRIDGGAADSTGTPGNATQNTSKGRVAIAAGQSAVVITNSLITTSSIVAAVLQTVDGTLTQLLTVVCTANTITITGNANATGACNVAWHLVE